MSMIQLKSEYPHNHISVPRVFIDQYMADANGEFVKVYLFLLRCMGSSSGSDCSISSIADHFNYTENDILRALRYWEKVGVLSIEINDKKQLTGICFKDLTETATKTTTMDKPIRTKKEGQATTKHEYSLDEVKAFTTNGEISELIFIIETYLKKPLNSTEMNTILFWYDSLKFSTDLIEYLVEYCITCGHSSLRYMDKVAMGWAENNINSIEKAKEHVTIHSKVYYSIMKAFGITGRNLADSEMTFVKKWTTEFSFDVDIIQEACKRTITATQKPSFEYADSILTNWHQQKVHTLKDIEALDANFHKTKASSTPSLSKPAKRNKFNDFEQRSYDFDQLEKMLLTSSVQ